MEKVQFAYNILRFSSEKVLKSFRNKTYNKNNPDNKIAILEHLQNKESERCKNCLSSLGDLDHFLLMLYIRKRSNYSEEDSEFSYASILRLFFEDYDDETLLGIRMSSFMFDYGMPDDIIKIKKKYMYLFNQMCKEMSDTECDTPLVRNILDDANYALGVSSDENIVKNEICHDKMQDILKAEFEACIIHLLESGEEAILNNRDRMSLMINYMRSILLCMNKSDIDFIKNLIDRMIPRGYKPFEVSLINSFFDNLESDREKYIGKSKVMM